MKTYSNAAASIAHSSSELLVQKLFVLITGAPADTVLAPELVAEINSSGSSDSVLYRVDAYLQQVAAKQGIETVVRNMANFAFNIDTLDSDILSNLAEGIARGEITWKSLLSDLVNNVGGDPGATFNNRATAAQYFTDALLDQSKGIFYSGEIVTGAARSLLDGVTADVATVNNVKNPLESLVAALSAHSASEQFVQKLFVLIAGAPADTVLAPQLVAEINLSGSADSVLNSLDTYLQEVAAGQGIETVVRNMASFAFNIDNLDPGILQSLVASISNGEMTWKELLSDLVNNVGGDLGATFNNRATAAQYFTDALLAQSKGVFYSGQGVSGAAQSLLDGVTADANTVGNLKTALESLVNNLNNKGIQSSVVDGYVKGAVVFVESNGNNQQDDGEFTTATDDYGNFTLPSNVPVGKIVAYGGIDIMTGQAFKGMLTAPAGATVVNPITSLIESLVSSGQAGNVGEAALAVQLALGMPVDVDALSFDPLAVLSDSKASVAEQFLALGVQSKALQVANIVTHAVAAMSAAGLAFGDAASSVINALARSMANGEVMSLSNSEFIAGIVRESLLDIVRTDSSPVPTLSAGVIEIINQLALVTAAANAAAEAATESNNIGIALRELAQVATVAQTITVAAISNAISHGENLEQVVGEFTDSNLESLIAGIQVGVLVPGIPVPPSEPIPLPEPMPVPIPEPIPSDTIAPVFSSAIVIDRTLVLTYDEALDAVHPPLAGAFTVKTGGMAQEAPTFVVVDSVARTVTLTLPVPAWSGQMVSVSYADPSVGNDVAVIQDLVGNDAVSLLDQSVTNNTPDTTAPALSLITVNGNKLVLTYGELLDAAHIPLPSAFTVKVGGIAQALPSAVEVDSIERTVTLTLAAPVGNGQEITLSYADSNAGNDYLAIQDVFGNDSVSLNDQSVINNTPDTTAPLFVDATVVGRTLVLTYNEALDAAHLPLPSAFRIKVDGTAQGMPVNGVVDSDAKTVTLTLAAAVNIGQIVSVGYADPTAGNDLSAIQDIAGNDAITLLNQPVSNNTPSAPVFLSAVVTGNTLLLNYSGDLEEVNTPLTSAFTVKVNGVVQNEPLAVVVDALAGRVMLTLAEAVENAQKVTVSYTDPSDGNDANAIQDSSGNDARSLFDRLVSNQTPDIIAPLFSGATIAINGKTLVLTYSETLDPVNIPPANAFAVKVDGATQAVPSNIVVDAVAKSVTLTLATAVSFGQVVTVSYSDPTIGNDTGAIQDKSGNDAIALSSQIVINNATKAPVFEGAIAQGNQLLLTYNKALDEGNVPPVSAFLVKVDGTAQAAPSSVTINAAAKTVMLTLAAPVKSGQVVKLNYLDQVGNDIAAIQDSDGNDAGTLENQSVVNYTPPAYASATVRSKTLVLTYSDALDSVGIPLASAFRIGVDGVDQAAPTQVVVDSVAKTVTLTLATTVASGLPVTLSYTDPTIGNDAAAIQDLLGNDAISLISLPVSNYSPPLLVSASVSANTLVLTYNDELDAFHAPALNAFSIKIDNTTQVLPTSAVVDELAKTVTLTLPVAITSNQMVTISYSDPTPENDLAAIQDLAGNDASSVSNRLVINATPDTVLPELASATVSSDGSKVVLMYKEALDALHGPVVSDFVVKVDDVAQANPTAVELDSLAQTVTLTLAAAVTNNQTVTVNYSDPTVGNDLAAIQDVAGNDAISLTNQAVTNTAINILAPSLSVVPSAGVDVNQLYLTVASVLPAGGVSTDLSFSGLPFGATIKDSNSNQVNAGVVNFDGNEVFTVEFLKASDIGEKLILTVTGRDAVGLEIGRNFQAIDLVYDVASPTELLSFSTNNQSMWGVSPGYIGWHEYIPLIGESPIVWDDASQEWRSDSDAEYWRSGQFDVVDVELNSADILQAISLSADKVLGEAKAIFDSTAYVVAAPVQQALDAAKAVFHTAEDAFYFGARTVDTVVRNTFEAAKTVYNGAKVVYDAASYVFNTVATNLHNDAASAWHSYENWWNGLNWAEQIIYSGSYPVAWGIWTTADLVYDGARATWNSAKNTFEHVATATYNAALSVYNAAASAVDQAAQATFALAKNAFQVAQSTYDAAMVLVHDAAQHIFDDVRTGVYGTLAAVNNLFSFDSKLKLDAEVFAQVGLQVDFSLDMGSVNSSVDYQLTSLTQYNKTTDMLAITPTMTNKTTGDSVAFDTISPNAKFYAALLYDVGADTDLFVDGQLVVGGRTIYNLSPNSDGLSIPLSVSTNQLTDILGVASGGNVDVGTLVLVDLDSSDLEPFEVPFLEDLSKGILTLEVALPNVETEGKAATYSAGTTYKEGDLLNVDFTELSSAFFNIVNAKIDFSDELKTKYGLDSLDGKTLAEMVTVAVKAVMATVWDVVGGHSEAVPILVIDTTDETSSSLLHLNLIPDTVMTSTTSAQTGSLGFYAAYGESDPVLKFQVDLDAAAALVVNEVLKAVAAAVTGGTTASFDDLIPLINPLDIEFGIEQVLKLVAVPQAQIDQVTKFVNLGFEFEAADLDAKAEVKFSQEFTLSIDDMSYRVTLEDNTTQTFTANNSGKLLIANASSHDLNHDGLVGYTLDIVPTAMFSNDTEAGLGLGYSLDYLKGSFAAGVSLPLGELIFGDTGPDWLNIEIPGIDIGIGPLLSIQGELDVLDVDVFEARFPLDVGSNSYTGAVDVELVGVNIA